MVKNTLLGQTVSFRCRKAKKKREGLLLEVLKQAENETQTPPCPHFSQCGGCSYQTLPYKEQMALKFSQVKELLEAVDPALPLKDCIESPAVWEYRNKMEFSFGDEVKDGPLTLGFINEASFYVSLRCPSVSSYTRYPPDP